MSLYVTEFNLKKLKIKFFLIHSLKKYVYFGSNITNIVMTIVKREFLFMIIYV